MRRALASLSVILMAVGAARADVGVILVFQGDNAAHKQCEIGLGLETFGAEYAMVRLEYAIFVNDKPVSNCLATWAASDRMIDTQCTGVTNLNYKCADITKIRPKGVDCLNAKGDLLKCGTLKIGGEKIFTFK